ncbi:hypothetical protein D3C75_1140490 [compost metagenome]
MSMAKWRQSSLVHAARFIPQLPLDTDYKGNRIWVLDGAAFFCYLEKSASKRGAAVCHVRRRIQHDVSGDCPHLHPRYSRSPAPQVHPAGCEAIIDPVSVFPEPCHYLRYPVQGVHQLR